MTAGSIFSFSEELINNNSGNFSNELLLTPKEIEKKINGIWRDGDVCALFTVFLAIEDKLIDDPRNVIYDGLYFELKDLLK